MFSMTDCELRNIPLAQLNKFYPPAYISSVQPIGLSVHVDITGKPPVIRGASCVVKSKMSRLSLEKGFSETERRKLLQLLTTAGSSGLVIGRLGLINSENDHLNQFFFSRIPSAFAGLVTQVVLWYILEDILFSIYPPHFFRKLSFLPTVVSMICYPTLGASSIMPSNP